MQSILATKNICKKDNQNILHCIHYITLLERLQFYTD